MDKKNISLSKTDEFYLSLLEGETKHAQKLISKILKNGHDTWTKKELEVALGVLLAKIELTISQGELSKENIKKERGTAINMIFGKH